MTTVCTSRFGTIEAPEEHLLTFPAGIIGFPHLTRYVTLDHDRDMPFKWLQCVEDGELAFIVMEASMVKPGYRVAISRADVSELGEAETGDYILLVILTVPSADPARITANLRGPIIVNLRTRMGKQLVLREDHPTRHPLFSGSTPRPGKDTESFATGAPATEQTLILSSK